MKGGRVVRVPSRSPSIPAKIVSKSWPGARRSSRQLEKMDVRAILEYLVVASHLDQDSEEENESADTSRDEEMSKLEIPEYMASIDWTKKGARIKQREQKQRQRVKSDGMPARPNTI